jgi:predicted lipid carrier protein YhbT
VVQVQVQIQVLGHEVLAALLDALLGHSAAPVKVHNSVVVRVLEQALEQAAQSRVAEHTGERHPEKRKLKAR